MSNKLLWCHPEKVTRVCLLYYLILNVPRIHETEREKRLGVSLVCPCPVSVAACVCVCVSVCVCVCVCVPAYLWIS